MPEVWQWSSDSAEDASNLLGYPCGRGASTGEPLRKMRNPGRRLKGRLRTAQRHSRKMEEMCVAMAKRGAALQGEIFERDVREGVYDYARGM